MSANSPQPSMPPGSTFGNYTLSRLIAVGGMAEIYLATTKGVEGFEKQLALKVIHPEFADDKSFVQMLVDEAKLSVTLNHPNIVQTFDLGQLGKIYYISMEFVDGCDYFQLLRKITTQQEVPIAAALYVAKEALLGLDYAHNKIDDSGTELKIIHRDISPQNILVSRSGAVKLVDFGIAKAANLSTKTRAGVIKGKLVYMSPEQSWGDPVDQRTDIFSAGVVLYEALTGGSLYLETNPVKLLQLVRKADIPLPSTIRREVDAELDGLVMRALAPRPADRYQTAREFSDTVAEYLHRQAPSYGGEALGALVSSVLDREAAAAEPVELSMHDVQVESMERKDFAVQGHSLVFSAEEMMGGAEAAPDVEFNVPAGQQDLSKGASAKLMLLEEDGTKSFDIEEQFVIGRGGDLRLSDGRVSRRHARIVAHEGGYLLEDLNSSNGTFLNDDKVAEIKRLKHGDRIRIGPFKMQFSLESARLSPVAPRPSVPPPPPQPIPSAGSPQSAAAPPPPPPPPGRPATQQRPASPSGPAHRSVAQPRPATPSGPSPRISAPPPPAVVPPRPQRAGSPTPTSASAPAADPDVTAKQRRLACMQVKMGEETLSLPIDGRLTLGQRINVGDMPVDGPSGVVVRRGEGYWVEPIPNRATISLNGQALTRPTQLNEGDTVIVGPLELSFGLGS